MHRPVIALAIVATALVITACGGGGSSSSTPTSGASGTAAATSSLPVGDKPFAIDASDFSTSITNPYWPMKPGDHWVYRETDAQGEVQRNDVVVMKQTKKIMGLDTVVVHDTVKLGGELTEDTYDWYAQDAQGNLWYFGEDTTEFEDGEPVGHAGAWEAGVDGALPGIVLPAEPEVGMSYRQEYSAGEAEDRAKVLSLDAPASVPKGQLTGALETEDTTPLEPNVVEHKFYVRDIGPVLAVQVKGESGREELVRLSRP
jgi:hypothetical protein